MVLFHSFPAFQFLPLTAKASLPASIKFQTTHPHPLVLFAMAEAVWPPGSFRAQALWSSRCSALRCWFWVAFLVSGWSAPSSSSVLTARLLATLFCQRAPSAVFTHPWSCCLSPVAVVVRALRVCFSFHLCIIYHSVSCCPQTAAVTAALSHRCWIHCDRKLNDLTYAHFRPCLVHVMWLPAHISVWCSLGSQTPPFFYLLPQARAVSDLFQSLQFFLCSYIAHFGKWEPFVLYTLNSKISSALRPELVLCSQSCRWCELPVHG